MDKKNGQTVRDCRGSGFQLQDGQRGGRGKQRLCAAARTQTGKGSQD
jgi:hypothetical protein